MIIDRLFSLVTHDVGIDLGTANTLVWVSGKGIVIREPSIIARHKKSKEILAVGGTAKAMEGRTPQTIESVRPLKDGVIADFDATASMLSYFIGKIHQVPQGVRRIGLPKIPRPRVVMGIPSGVTEVERRAVADAAVSSGARKAYLIEEPMAAAIGAGLDVIAPGGIFVVDIGGGTSEIAVISLGGIVLTRGLRIAGDEIDEAIISYLRARYSILLGRASAENLKIELGSALPFEKEKFSVVRGRDLERGLPRSVRVSSQEVREALLPVVHQILSRISDTLEEAPPELSGDVMERGIMLAGGGALLYGLDRFISESLKVPVWVCEDPLTAVVRGTGRVLSDASLLERVRVTGGLG